MKFRCFLALLLCLLVPLLANVSAINDGDATIDDEDIPDPPFIAFAKVGNVGALENLLKSTKTEGERSAMLNTLDKKDRSALVWSLRRHKPDVARFLLKEKIDVMHKDCQNHTSLWWAIHRHEWDIAISLIEEGVEVNSDHTNPYLYTASMYPNSCQGCCWHRWNIRTLRLQPPWPQLDFTIRKCTMRRQSAHQHGVFPATAINRGCNHLHF